MYVIKTKETKIDKGNGLLQYCFNVMGNRL